MKKLKSFKSVVIYFLILTVAVSVLSIMAPSAKAASDPAIDASAALLVEVKSGQVLYSLNANEKLYPASTTKIMTVLLAIEAVKNGTVSLDDMVTITSNVAYNITDDAVTANLQPGEQISLRNLLYCALVASDNDACNAIAEYIGGDVATFIQMMNAKAEALGCTGTHFANANGLSDQNHYTTAWDLYLIMKCAISYSDFTTIDATPTYTVPATNMSAARSLITTDNLILKDSTYYYPYATGGKTGYTEAAGHCLVSTAANDELSFIAVVMGTQSVTDANGITDTKSFSESSRLYDWGFDNFSYKEILLTTDLVDSVPVTMGEGTDSVILCPETSLTALLDNEADPNTFQYNVTVYNLDEDGKLKAPIAAGDVLGEVTVSDGDTVYGTVKLVSNASISLSHLEYLKKEIKSTLAKPVVILIIVCIFVFFALYITYVIYFNYKRKRDKERRRARALKLMEETNRKRTESFENIDDLFKDNQPR